jgi:tetratricopeptide (TPR) repeat protein
MMKKLPTKKRTVRPKSGSSDESSSRERLGQAQMLMFEAWEEPNDNKAITLAKKALKLSEDCADAHSFLAEYVAPNRRRDVLEKAVLAGERALGEEAFESMRGEFWGWLETRPYMRALEALGSWYENIAYDFDEAVSLYRKMLDLNPNDNQGVRYGLLPLLIVQGRDEEAESLYKQYDEDASAIWAYSRVLLDFRKHGRKGSVATASVRDALKINPYTPDYLIGKKNMPDELPPYYSHGSEDEAILCADTCRMAWGVTPGAISWLRENIQIINPCNMVD